MDNLTIFASNMLYSGASGLLTISLMVIGYKVLDRMTHFVTDRQLKEGNMAVGLLMGGAFIGIGVAVGLVTAVSML